MTLLFVRHGQTDWNAKRLIQGRTDIPLNETGREQAKTQAAALAGRAIDIIYTSPMLRAREMAEIINQPLGLPLRFDDRLVERCYGDFEGTDPECSHSEFERALLQNGGESLAELHGRVLRFLEDITAAHAGQTVLVVAHGGVGRMVQYCYRGEKPVRIENGTVMHFEGRLAGLVPLPITLMEG